MKTVLTGKTGRYLKFSHILGPFFQVCVLLLLPFINLLLCLLCQHSCCILKLNLIHARSCLLERFFSHHGNAMSKYFSLIHFSHPFISPLVCLCISFIQLSPEALLLRCIELLCNLHIQISPSTTLHFLGSLAICQTNVK